MRETRQKILDAAEKLILLKGLAHVTTKEIAREVGLSEGALYRHFDHKEEIFFALMATHLPAFYDAFQTHRGGTATLRENLAALALAAIHYYEQILPMGVSFLADTELLTQFRATTQPLGLGPLARPGRPEKNKSHPNSPPGPVSDWSRTWVLISRTVQTTISRGVSGDGPATSTS